MNKLSEEKIDKYEVLNRDLLSKIFGGSGGALQYSDGNRIVITGSRIK